MLDNSTKLNRDNFESKRIHISSKRQITIPAKFYDAIGFDDEIECIFARGMLILTPVVKEESTFAEEILADLIKQGYSGEGLLLKFKEISKKIRPAVESLIHEAEEIAKQKNVNYEDIASDLFYVNESDE